MSSPAKRRPKSKGPPVRTGMDGLIGHEPQEQKSLLSAGEWKHTDLEGFINLSFVLLIVAALQLLYLNYCQNGFMVDFTLALELTGDIKTAIALSCLLMLTSGFTFTLVQAAATKALPESVISVMFILKQMGAMALVVVYVWLFEPAPLVACTIAVQVLILIFKDHSYYVTNKRLAKLNQRLAEQRLQRKQSRSSQGSTGSDSPPPTDTQSGSESGMESNKDEAEDLKEAKYYPKNVRLGDFIYFQLAPTLCYEPFYPRTKNIRPLYFLKEAVAGLGCAFILYVMALQYIVPAFQELAEPKDVPLSLVVKQMAAVAIPSMIMWLLMFYAVFHCCLNAMAELLRFADRRFYLDFWNAPTIGDFWRRWNRPVHEWLLRHVYLESIGSAKFSKVQATFATFFVSALFHEVVLSLAFRMLRPWFFLGMLVQAPLLFASSFLAKAGHGRRWGNILVWVSLFAGQPLVEMYISICQD